jgi:hypothetical protein
VLTGLPIGIPDLSAQCSDCGRTLREGERVLVYAYRAAEATEWDLARCYCPECRPDEITTPTLGTSEVLVDAMLGTMSDVRAQTHHFCLRHVERVDESLPTEGTAP